MEEKHCPNCNHPLHSEAHFCPACMTVLEPAVEVTVPRPKGKVRSLIWALCLVALVIGGIGVRFLAAPADTAVKSVTVWTMQLRPNGGVDSFGFCREQEIVGFGWGLKGTPTTMTEYRSMRTREGAYPGDKSLDRTLDSFENMTSSERAHLVWVRDANGDYYICEITGSYQYNRDKAHEQAGIVNFAPCSFYSVGRDLVPKAVSDALNASGVIQFVRDMEAIETTQELWRIAREK